MRFGLDSAPDQLDSREFSLIVAALGNQVRYCNGLAERNKDPEAQGRNIVNALELKVLCEKVRQMAASLQPGDSDKEEHHG